MKRPTTRLVLAAAIIIVAAASAEVATNPTGSTQEALERALDDERYAKAVYQAVLDRHGDVRPFSNIRGAEEKHESALLDLFEKYEMEPPVDRWLQQEMEAPETLREACAQAVEAEKDNIAMYDELFELIEESDTDIRNVFTHLRSASEEHHLPAFERCGEGGQGRGRGRGKGGGPGRRCQ